MHRAFVPSRLFQTVLGSFVLATLPLPSLVLGADARVAVFANAEPDYLEARRDEHGNLRNETYFILEGTFFPGQIRDRTLEQTTLREIARILAPEFAKQNYTPASTVNTADLMLVVHWGTTVRAKPDTEYIVDTQRQQSEALNLRAELKAFTDGPPELGERATAHPNMGMNAPPDEKTGADHYYDSMMNDLYWGAGNANVVAGDRIREDVIGSSMASLLGFAKDLREDAKKPFGSERGRTFRSMLEDERYFIVVMAYDFQAFQASGFKQTKRLWTCRLSMHSPGINFRQAVFRVGAVGSSYFGTHTPEVTIKRPEPKEGVVEIGEPTVVSW